MNEIRHLKGWEGGSDVKGAWMVSTIVVSVVIVVVCLYAWWSIPVKKSKCPACPACPKCPPCPTKIVMISEGYCAKKGGCGLQALMPQ